MPEQTDVDSIEFRPATGGLVSHTTSMGKGKSEYDMGPRKRETAVHASLGHAIKHMKSALGHHFKKEKKSGMKKG